MPFLDVPIACVVIAIVHDAHMFPIMYFIVYSAIEQAHVFTMTLKPYLAIIVVTVGSEMLHHAKLTIRER